jgi:delta24-sterol reductase
MEDIAVPYAAAKQVIDHLDDSFCKYPLWLCPVRQADHSACKGPHCATAYGPMGFETEYTPDMMISAGI